MTRRNSGDHLSRAGVVSGGRELNAGIPDNREEQRSVLWFKDGAT